MRVRFCRDIIVSGDTMLCCGQVTMDVSSDRTDLSTESGSGPIQLDRDRYRATRRSVADSPPHCMNAPQRTLQATGQKRGKISEK